MMIGNILSASTQPVSHSLSLGPGIVRYKPIEEIDPIKGRQPEESKPTEDTPSTPEATSPFDVEDTVELSPEAQKAAEKPSKPAPEQKGLGSKELTEEEQSEVQELKDRDTEVRAHEQAHIAAGGGFVQGGATYEYQTGPDGQRYAVGGEVSIDTSPVADDPEATIAKMQQVRAAAMAPAEPSGQDQKVAAAASAAIQEAQAELSASQSEEAEGEESSEADTTGKSAEAVAEVPKSDKSKDVSQTDAADSNDADSSVIAAQSSKSSNAGVVAAYSAARQATAIPSTLNVYA